MRPILYSFSDCKSKILRWSALLSFFPLRGLSVGPSPLQINLSLRDRTASVRFGVGFIVCAKVSDSLDHYFWIVAARKGALRVSPIVFGLAFVVARYRPPSLLSVGKMAWRFGGVFVNREVAERVDRIALLSRLNNKFLGKFVVGESRQAQYACRVGCRQIASELICEVVKKSFGLTLTEPAHFPHDLVLAGR